MNATEIERLSENELVDLANQLQSAKRHADLETVLRRLMAVSANPAHFACPLGWALLNLNRFADAERAFALAAPQSGSAQAEALGGQGIAIVHQGRFDEGEPLLQKAMAGGYRTPQMLIVLAQGLDRLGRYADALAYTGELTRLAPGDGNLLFLHGNQLLKAGRLPEAAAVMKTLVSSDKARARFGAQAANVIAAAGEFESAADLIYQALRKNTDDAGLHVLLAHCLANVHADKGFAWLQARMAEAADDAVAPYHLSRLLEKQGAVDAADTMARASLARAPDSLLAQGQCGRIDVVRGQYASAAAIFDRLWVRGADNLRNRTESADPASPPRRAVTPYPIIYFAVEIGSRELQTRLIMARLAVAAGLNAVILSHDVLKEAATRLPPGLIVFKSISALERKLVGQAAAAGHFFTVIDEEAFGRSGGSEVILKNFDLRNLAGCAKVFAPGAEYVRGVLEEAPHAASQIVAVGNPRTDLYDPRFRDLFAPETDAVRSEFGRTILVCTNFGSWNSAVNPYPSICDLALKLAGVAMDSSRGRWLLEICRDSNQAECRNTGVIRDAATALAAAYPAHKIVVRPHPIEDVDYWKRFAATAPNIVVGGASSLAAHMMAADVTVHLPGCGTGLEARLLGRPTVCINMVSDLAYPKLGISSRISPTVQDVPALVAAVGDAIAHPDRFSVMSPEQEELLSARVLRSGQLTSARIVDELKRLYDTAQPGTEAGPSFTPMLEQALMAGHQAAHVKTFGNVSSARIKRLQMTTADIADNLKTLGGCLGMPAEFRVDSPVDGIFIVSPPR